MSGGLRSPARHCEPRPAPRGLPERLQRWERDGQVLIVREKERDSGEVPPSRLCLPWMLPAITCCSAEQGPGRCSPVCNALRGTLAPGPVGAGSEQKSTGQELGSGLALCAKTVPQTRLPGGQERLEEQMHEWTGG